MTNTEIIANLATIIAKQNLEISELNTEVQHLHHELLARMSEADRKTENSSELPNNYEDLQDWKDRMWAEAIVTDPTISKMEQVDKDINVRSKDETKLSEIPTSKYEPKTEQTEREGE